MLTQKDIDQMSDALRAQGLTWNQTNFAVSLVRNAIDTEREACAVVAENSEHNGGVVDCGYETAKLIRMRSNA